MKTTLSSIDIKALVDELRQDIIGSWLNNIYSIGKKVLILRFRKSSENSFELVLELGKRFHKSRFVRKKPDSPSNKVATMRKHIRDLPISNFYQVGFDRVIVFEIAYKDSHYKLVVELFGEGNYILVGPENKIIVAEYFRRMRDRDIHPGKEFHLPPSTEINVTNLTQDIFSNEIAKFEGKLISFLNQVVGLGPLYSKEIVARINTNKKNVQELEEEEKNKLWEAINTLQQIINTGNFEITEYIDEETVIDITPIPISKYDDLTAKKVDSFNDSLDSYYSTLEEEPTHTENKVEVSGHIKKLQKNLNDQQKHLEKLTLQELEEKKKGDLLYENFVAIDELLTTVLNARKNGVEWKVIEEKLQMAKEKGIAAASLLDRIDANNKLLWINLFDEQENATKTIELDFTLTVADSANEFYQKAKKARRKIPGALEAIERSKVKITEALEKETEIVEVVETKKMVEQRTKKWYEKFHWFICDEHIVIGGTDAKTNERIYKTYLDDEDLFVHADAHGAPFVIVKEGQKNLSEECLNEIGIFALSYSQMWKGKSLAGDAYYVLPEQASMTPPSGQYLSKGSIMIYGEKRYIRNIELELAIGVIFYENYAQVIGGPLKSIAAKTEQYVTIVPGNIQKGTVAKEIRQKIINMSPEDERYKSEALTINEFLLFIPGDSIIK